jgi:threonine dehydrogenase-like Zn-dependent dehydrogenase
VGIVTGVGDTKNQNWINKRVFAFQPHSSSFLSKLEDLSLIPDEIPDEDAAFLPNMETAVNFLMDGVPMVGERVAVIGLGVIGLLTTSILSQFPLKLLSAIDLLPNRQITSGKIQGAVGISPVDAISTRPENGYDLIYELSGSPAGLNLALELGGFESRIVIGSWYGKKAGEINLGGNFHRSRMRLISSQVSTISSSLTGRWTKQRRFSIAFRQLAMIKPSRWITHRYPLEQATEAYNQLVSHPEETLQVLFTY